LLLTQLAAEFTKISAPEKIDLACAIFMPLSIIVSNEKHGTIQSEIRVFAL